MERIEPVEHAPGRQVPPSATLSGGVRPSARPRRTAARIGAAVAACCLVLGGGWYVLAGPGDGGHRGGGRSAGPAAVAPDLTAVAALLERQDTAVREHDRNGFLATVDPAATTYLTREAQVFGNLAALPITGWRQRLDPVQPVPPTATGATLRVTLRYRLAGYDRDDVISTRYLTVARSAGGRWLVTGDGTPAGMADGAQIWDAGAPVTVVRGAYSLVIGESTDPGARARLQEIAARLDQAVPIVTGVVGSGWAGRVVALAPASDLQVDGLIGGPQNTREIAALASVTPDPRGTAHGQDRVVIAPQTFGRLNALGRHVVLTHELTHVALGAARDASTPMWLVEGVADYAGYRGRPVTAADAARELRAEVTAGRMPAGLPGRDQFAGSADRLPQAYEEAWLACRMIAERYGEATLVRLYHAAGSQSETAALHEVLGITPAALVAQWQAYLRTTLS